MFSLRGSGKIVWAQSKGRRLILCVLVVLMACAALFVYAKTARRARGAFGLAEDMPRGALVYAQFADLPALVERWEHSTLKAQYLESANFKSFKERHLALKLVERWGEFNDALGFTLDATTIAGATDKRAGLAIYDIGRLDLVFIAPLDERRAAVTQFVQNRDAFEETELPDGNVYYSREVEADRGRQKQKLVFATARGRFVLATSVELLLRALANITGKSAKDHLSDDASFRELCKGMEPHAMTVWVDQSKLNDDYYFKHYWAMGNVADLKTLRAGIFDFELREEKWIERREFLTTGGAATSARRTISTRDAERISSLIPADIPFSRLRALDDDGAQGSATLARDTLLDRLATEQRGEAKNWSWQSYDEADFRTGSDQWWGESRYSTLDDDYEKSVDDARDAGLEDKDDAENALRAETGQQALDDLREVLQPAAPFAGATAESPQTTDGPLFVEFRRALVLSLARPASLDERALENALARVVESRLMLAGSRANLVWTNHETNGRQWHKLELPMLGWGVCYARRDAELVLANSENLLAEMLATSVEEARSEAIKRNADANVESEANDKKEHEPFEELTLIRFAGRRQAFDNVLKKLDGARVNNYLRERGGDEQSDVDAASQAFFTGNIGSLLDVAASVRQVTLKRSARDHHLREEVEISLNPTHAAPPTP